MECGDFQRHFSESVSLPGVERSTVRGMNRWPWHASGALLLALLLTGCAHLPAPGSAATGPSPAPGLVSEEFLFERGPTPECHASTVVETPAGLVAAWFAGAQESAADVGIWLSRHEGGRWSAPERILEARMPDGQPCACWNPVLFQPRGGPLMLFFKAGPDEPLWWGEVATSVDHGRHWSAANRLPEGILGPIKNKPVQLPDGAILSPSSTEAYLRLPRGLADVWKSHLESSTDGGRTWTKVGPLRDPLGANVIQPTLLVHRDGPLQLLLRSQAGHIHESWSVDGGRQWSVVMPTTLPNPDAGIDAVSLRDGRALLVYNHSDRHRRVLNVAVSNDGRHWEAALELENQAGEFSYPAVIQTADDLVHITYTWKRRRIKHVVLDPAALQVHPLVAGQWPR